MAMVLIMMMRDGSRFVVGTWRRGRTSVIGCTVKAADVRSGAEFSS
jgi:hypothetical protein